MTITVPLLGTLAGLGAFVFVFVVAIVVLSLGGVVLGLMQGRRY